MLDTCFKKHVSIFRRGLLLALLTTGSYAARAQTGGVGIGTTAPDVSAALDIVSTGKGVLLPRVTDATAIATPATGLLVFQTGGTPGFYYNIGTPAAPSWQQLATAVPANLTGDVTSTGAATTYANVVPAAKGGAGTVSGLLKADGAGTVSPAVAGTDYAAATGSPAYVQNRTTPQPNSNFNVVGTGTVRTLKVSGDGTVSGTLSAEQGFLPPRLTAAQRDATSPVAGLLVFQTDGTQGLYYYTGLLWVNLANGRTPDANGSTELYAPFHGNAALAAGIPGNAGSNDGSNYANDPGAARFNGPIGVAVDAGGTVYVADQLNHTIRTISSGQVRTLTSNLISPKGVAVLADGTVYVSDQRVVRKITPVYGGGVALSILASGFSNIGGLAVDAAGTVYVTDQDVISKITPAGIVSFFASGFSGPNGVAVDVGGNVYVAESGRHIVSKVTAGGRVTTLAGTAGSTGSADGTGAAARFNGPCGVAVDAGGMVYVSDLNNNTIRAITPAGVVTTLAGMAGSPGSVVGVGAAARFNGPYGLALDAANRYLYVADRNNQTIREIR